MASLTEEVQARAAEQLTMPEDTLPSKELPRFKRFLKGEESRLKKLHQEGGLGREVCHVRAAIIDALIQHLFEAAVQSCAKTRGWEVAGNGSGSHWWLWAS